MEKKKHAPRQDSVRRYMKEISIAMFYSQNKGK